MANDNPIRTFTAFDIERYHKGLLSKAERHALEKAALDDPFLADALEGYAVPGVQVKQDLEELSEKLSARTEAKKVIPFNKGGGTSFPWLRAAAMFIVIAGAGLLFYRFGFNKGKEEIAQSSAKEKTTGQAFADSNNAARSKADSTATDIPAANAATANESPRQGSASSVEQGLNFQKKDIGYKAENVGNAKLQDSLGKGQASADKSMDKDQRRAEVAATVPDYGQNEVPSAKALRYDGVLDQRKISEGYAQTQREMETKQARPVSANKSAQNNAYLITANTFRGRVTDANKNPVPFANVTNIEDNVGTYADAQGYFNLTSPDSVLNVKVRGLGYTNNNLSLTNNAKSNEVILQEDRSLNEVVISNKKPNATSRSRNANMKLEGEPEPEDGWENYDSYLANNLNVPQEYKFKNSGSDEVKLSFEVNKLGEPVNIRVEKSLCDRCDQEAIRLITQGPKWKRKARKGRTTVTVSF